MPELQQGNQGRRQPADAAGVGQGRSVKGATGMGEPGICGISPSQEQSREGFTGQAMAPSHPEGINRGMGGKTLAPALNEIVLEGRGPCHAVGIAALAAVVHRVEAGMHGDIIAAGFAAIKGHSFSLSPQLLP